MKKKLLDKYQTDFDVSLKIAIRNNIEFALEVYTEFVRDNNDFFQSPKRASVMGYLRTFVIEKQLYDTSFSPIARYEAYYKEVNSFHYKALFLKTGDFLLNICKTVARGQLPARSKYRLEHARNNEMFDGQMSLPFCNKDTVSGNEKYAVLTYSINKENKIIHMDIMIPDSKLHSFYYCDNLLELPREIKSVQIMQENKEEALVNLKNELDRQIRKIE